ncbi:hypothetical protein A2630_03025 [Candidatus Woesebacteria bacterium RIFCSPHIGHO2_01_FULL_44_10]|uniref:Uncharacterized protein n=1 Tax=Candidatus Woesebacteria bacterium RIFCSPLOWO2_01_FULL_44_14 TaxID=1802525 RepID=A0A1F8C2Q1_9BACT|nr:MAG: hypothetical protein A2630_03025 [Candidatus Woesebacteria bacterium RIFCSPHIGHO2_01_FULL_44_10]OGM55755.1 MAG: hypothetical protein A3F62_04715 [Candidatus Woesebacteria bacterium RIFCSPHIGHO2_12_FULL_44_11]OGM70542.1 MAG: hypothetical protein A2975_02055 [Candidatus Woesebacteria bacterium RIFCSPLOWO2_01_FULL_44_14]
MSTIEVVSAIFGALVFLFIFWRRLKEDYESQAIFSIAFFMLTGVLAAGLFVRYLPRLNAWWFWADFLGLAVGFTLGILKFRLKFYELLEASCLASLFWLAFVFVAYTLVDNNLPGLIASTFIIALIVSFYLVDGKYKSFSWYKSGKIGFSGLAISGIFFLTRAVVSLLTQNVVSFVSEYDSIASGILAFGSFLLLYNLAIKK